MSKTPKEECEELLSSAMPFAERMLSRHREFYPYGNAAIEPPFAAKGEEKIFAR
jgi:hypothetical protein